MELQVLPGLQARAALVGLQVQVEQEVQAEQEVLLEQEVLREQEERAVHQESRGRKVLKDLLAHRALRDRKVRLDRKA